MFLLLVIWNVLEFTFFKYKFLLFASTVSKLCIDPWKKGLQLEVVYQYWLFWRHLQSFGKCFLAENNDPNILKNP